ncbi:MAG: DNA-directed RNA polymerase subunit beta [Chlamydiae bacterium]|nr:DNA-directed RNA polymerase subunit beta [Chlamydiota bacterium]MBI3277657.1 DNA-directed RNA polymerase subunit beta [Chlamydiota bacterium]
MLTKNKEGLGESQNSELYKTLDLPNLIQIQTRSYKDFLQEEILPEERENVGLHSVFSEVFPIKSYDENISLEYVSYSLGVPKYEIIECQRRGLTYSAPLNVTFRLREGDTVKEETVYMGNIPLMTETGTFIINGAERVIVSQLHRSPGVFFEQEVHPGGMTLFSARVIPYRGIWIEAEFDINDLIHVYMDRQRRRRKILATAFLRALGYSSDAEILALFYEVEEIQVDKKLDISGLKNRILAAPVMEVDTGAVIEKAGRKVSKALLDKMDVVGLKKISLLQNASEEDPIIKMLLRDATDSTDAALKEIYRRLRPGDPPTVSNARALMKRLFFDPKRYDLGKVGRFKLNQRLGLPLTKEELETVILRKEDVVEALKYVLNLRKGKGYTDDIDHLGNRRVRSVGELLVNQCRIGLARMERVIKERMNLFDVESESLTPHKLLNPKGLSGVIRDFFGRSQLSQFLDQTNPLAELTHKRRLSALGPGGLNRERAGFEVRDVHTSHYGRICPIETPEGPNIGLISSLSTYAKISEYGFVETPYRKVVKGRVTDEIVHLTGDQEEGHVIVQANARVDKNGSFLDDVVQVRINGEFQKIEPSKVEYMDVAPLQLVSVAAGLIPFLEHDDANRALMGSNMQRQAVPLLFTQVPLVGTGLEYRAAKDSGVVVVSKNSGEVSFSDADQIVVGDVVYPLRKFMRSNAGTTINQRPLVSEGDKVKKGQVIADGMATQGGELALGRNVLVAFMPWEGYNFEDAILISQRLVKEDAYTSIHIEEFELGARDTKLGKEEITRDIPNVGEEALKNLAEDGIVRIGAEVKPGDILVGKITPKSETELSPEERLLRAIFGEKAADVRDASLTVPSGIEGMVIDVKVFSRKEKTLGDEEQAEERAKVRKLNDDYRKKSADFKKNAFAKIRDILLNAKLQVDVVNSETGEVLISRGSKVTKGMVDKLEALEYESIEMEKCVERDRLKMVLWEYHHNLEALQTVHSMEVEKLKKGDELEPGVIKKVKVYVATKRKLSVGDKMAGRHGNKGVIAKVLPEEDMPFLADGTVVDMVLNPLGVPSRMNVGQVMETHMGWVAKMLGTRFFSPVFSGIKTEEIRELLKKAHTSEIGKFRLFDGRTGETFDQEVVVGYIYMLKLAHLAADKIHARAIGPYSLVTQQPLGGKAQFGGQRFGEMEVWALEAYGAAYTLQEILTVKSDDVLGRTRMYESIVKGQNILEAGTPESFNVLVKEIQGLALDIRAEKES